MRRLLPLLLCACLLALTACQRAQEPSSQEPITLFRPHSELQTTFPQFQPPTAQSGTAASTEASTTRPSANDSYGETHTLADEQDVVDESVDFRTKDSYRFESAAVEYARELYRAETPLPDTLRITDIRVSNCLDDGQTVYYSVSLDGSYALQSGERIERGVLYDLGVRKKSGEVFDAQMQILEIEEGYSLLLPKYTQLPPFAGEEADALDALVPKLLKDADGTKILSVTAVPDRPHVYTVLCTGVNDYGIAIRQTRDVELCEGEDGWSLRTAAETF